MIRWLRAFFDRHDPALDQLRDRMTHRYTTERTYDYARAVKSAKRAQRRTETGRVIPRPKAPPRSNVVVFRERKDGTR